MNSLLQIGKWEISAIDAQLNRLLAKRNAWCVVIGREDLALGRAEPLPVSAKGLKLSQLVEMTIKTFGESEFTIPQIESYLRSRDLMPPAVQPRARIAMILKRLEKDGIVDRVRVPQNKTKPHVFKCSHTQAARKG